MLFFFPKLWFLLHSSGLNLCEATCSSPEVAFSSVIQPWSRLLVWFLRMRFLYRKGKSSTQPRARHLAEMLTQCNKNTWYEFSNCHSFPFRESSTAHGDRDGSPCYFLIYSGVYKNIKPQLALQPTFHPTPISDCQSCPCEARWNCLRLLKVTLISRIIDLKWQGLTSAHSWNLVTWYSTGD